MERDLYISIEISYEKKYLSKLEQCNEQQLKIKFLEDKIRFLEEKVAN